MTKRIFLILSFLCFITLSFYGADKTKTLYRNAIVMAYSPVNSIYEDENIILQIYNEALWATNKTDKTIFIDLSRSFLLHNGSSYPITSEHQDEKKASKTNLTSEDIFLSIAPAVGSEQNETFICKLAGNLYGKYTTVEEDNSKFSKYEERMLNIISEMATESLSSDPKGKEYRETMHRHLTEDESILTIGATISYSFDKKSNDWTNVVLSTWICDVFFSPYYVYVPDRISKKERKGFGIKKAESVKVYLRADSPFEFDQDKSPIFICDWSGNFKKGTFVLDQIAIMDMTGIISKLKTLSELKAKKEIIFDGKNADWGEMKPSRLIYGTTSTRNN